MCTKRSLPLLGQPLNCLFDSFDIRQLTNVDTPCNLWHLYSQYACDQSSYEKSGGALLRATVTATIQQSNTASSLPLSIANSSADDPDEDTGTFRYVADATLYLANSTVVHLVTSSNRDDYVNLSLTRSVSYDANSTLLMLTPEERMNGFIFALLWKPS